jgi:hypothetical protein
LQLNPTCYNLDWFDILGTVANGEVLNQTTLKASAADKAFIKSVIAGIAENQPEAWVRQQFRTYTINFLEAAMMRKHAKGSVAEKLAQDFVRVSPILEGYACCVCVCVCVCNDLNCTTHVLFGVGLLGLVFSFKQTLINRPEQFLATADSNEREQFKRVRLPLPVDELCIVSCLRTNTNESDPLAVGW